jgi:hypothetical protein
MWPFLGNWPRATRVTTFRFIPLFGSGSIMNTISRLPSVLLSGSRGVGVLLVFASAVFTCGNLGWAQATYESPKHKGQDEVTGEKTFGQDVEFLQQHVDTIVLRGDTGAAQVAVVPAYQGRVMTSAVAPRGWNFEATSARTFSARRTSSSASAR